MLIGRTFPGTGGELARHLLDEAKLTDVKVETTDKGDHYDPGARAVRLLPQHYNIWSFDCRSGGRRA